MLITNSVLKYPLHWTNDIQIKQKKHWKRRWEGLVIKIDKCTTTAYRLWKSALSSYYELIYIPSIERQAFPGGT